MNFYVDKLKICYTLADNSPIRELIENPIETYELPHWDFCLERVEGKHYDYIYKIIYLERTSNSPTSEFDHQCFGVIRWGLRADKNSDMDGYVWVEIDNKQFYLNYDYNTKNRLVYLGYIETMLGLEFHNLTHLDLAFDDKRNLSKRLIQAIRNESLVPIVNGTRVTDRNALIEDILYQGVGSCNRIREYSLIVQHKKRDLRLSVYNKKREVENSSKKYYITDANGSPKFLSRLEVRINGDALNEYMRNERIEYHPMMFTDEALLYRFFLEFSNRVLRFRTLKGRKPLDVLDVIS